MLIGSLCHRRGSLTCFMLASRAIAAQLFLLFGNTIFHHVIKLIEQANFGRQGSRGAGDNSFGFAHCHSQPDLILPTAPLWN